MRTDAATQGGVVYCEGDSEVVLGDQSCPNKFQGTPNVGWCAAGSCNMVIGGVNSCL